MDVLILLLAASLALAASGVTFFVWNLQKGNHDHYQRLTLLPLEEPCSSEAHIEEPPTTTKKAPPKSHPSREIQE